MDIKNIWWQRTSCGINAVNDVAEHVMNDESTLILCKVKLPWKDRFHDSIKEEIRTSNKSFAFFRGKDIPEPGRFLFDNYCPEELQTEFWPAADYSYPHFLAEQDNILLNQRIIVVSDIDSQNAVNSWISFIDAYKKTCASLGKEAQRAVFVLEYNGTGPVTGSRNISNISFAPTEIDIYTYNIIITRKYDLSPALNKYLAELITALAGSNIVLNGLLAEQGPQLMALPYPTYTEVADGNPDTETERLSDAATDARVRLAQLKALYPVVEQKRCELIEKYLEKIEKTLPWKNDYGEKRDDPYDFELRDIVFKFDEIGVSHEDRELVKVLKDIRNSLAHNRTLSYKEIKSFCR